MSQSFSYMDKKIRDSISSHITTRKNGFLVKFYHFTDVSPNRTIFLSFLCRIYRFKETVDLNFREATEYSENHS